MKKNKLLLILLFIFLIIGGISISQYIQKDDHKINNTHIVKKEAITSGTSNLTSFASIIGTIQFNNNEIKYLICGIMPQVDYIIENNATAKINRLIINIDVYYSDTLSIGSSSIIGPTLYNLTSQTMYFDTSSYNIIYDYNNISNGFALYQTFLTSTVASNSNPGLLMRPEFFVNNNIITIDNTQVLTNAFPIPLNNYFSNYNLQLISNSNENVYRFYFDKIGEDLGYYNGYLNGYLEGNDNGYSNGYQDGLEASNNDFSTEWLTSIFNSVNSFLQIQILPGLTILDIIKYPLIIAFIYFLFKLLR